MRRQVTSAGMVEKSGPRGRADHAAKGRNEIAGHLGKVIARFFPIVNEGIGDQIGDARLLVLLDELRQSPCVPRGHAEVVQIVE